MISFAALKGRATSATAAALVVVTLASAAPRADDSPVLVAMQDEMKRSMAELKLKDQPEPYYISYGMDDTREWTYHARLGATIENSTRRSRQLVVEVRVGDYGFDSSHFITANRGTNAAAAVSIPIDDNYDAMRRELWLATDAAYKRALLIFARKKAAFQNRSVTDQLPDLSRETPAETVLPVAADRPSPDEWAARVRDMSAAFSSAAGIQNSDVVAGQQSGTQYFINSEGFKEIEPLNTAWVRVTADTQTPDGSALRDGFSLAEARLADMPASAALIARTRNLAARMEAARSASIGDEYTGPVLVDGEASQQILAQAFLPLTLARRPNDVENNGRGAPPAQATPFLSRIGLRVLPDAFSVSDTPSLTAYEGKPVAGAFMVDDEGVPAKDVPLVENGKLLTLLTSRAPQKKLLQSNGHGRSGAAQAGVFQMKSSQAVPEADLKQKYLALLKDQDKEFGYIVRSLGAGNGTSLADVVKVTPDGKETPVRGLRLAAIAAPTFRNILEASTERPLFNYLTTSGDLVSIIAPSMIYEELEIQQVKEIVQKPPIVPSPLAR
ncbi:MAG TPA: metallopeptidase TldD-related protein [Vicinamibacterales bacterium]|nr:metallopeptidase TldD-related protein [Vicinamibacterales bacterium]